MGSPCSPQEPLQIPSEESSRRDQKGKRRLPFVGTEHELQDKRRSVEIQGNLTFSPGKTAGQIEAGGVSIGHKVHA